MLPRRLVTCGLLVLCVCAAVGCGDERPIPTVYPLPAPYQAVDLSYLPFEYLPDGCYQRASYISIELALLDIVTVGIDAETCDFKMGLHGPFGEPWRHHTVPAVIKEDNSLGLLDPLASPELLSIEEWLAGMTSKPVRVFVTAASYPTSHNHETECGSVTESEGQRPQKVSEMTPWLLANIMGDCAALRQFHRDSPNYDPAREERLLARTAELVLRLEKMGLLDTSMGKEPLQKIAQGPWCPDPVPK